MIELLKKYDRPVPRYTSYPTAPHFRHEINSDAYSALLSKVSPEESVSLYIHIPFCRHLCTYCGCNTKVVDNVSPIEDYLEVLKKEVALIASSLGRRQKVSHIHFGGGTPNYAPISALQDLLKTIERYFSFNKDLVIAMEVDPRLLTQDNSHALVKMGVNRISMGVQEFNLEVQKAINRIQPFEMVRDCTSWFREAGIKSINFDMIYGLPLQTIESMQQSMRLLNEISPERVAIFGYAHVPWFKEHQLKLEKYNMPDTFERYQMAENARNYLIEKGYVPIGIDHFAKPADELAVSLKEKKLHRNFQGYTTDKEQVLIGLGQTSISDYGRAYVQNTLKNKEYREEILAGRFPVIKSCILSDEDVYRRAVIEQIMCYDEVNLRNLKGADVFASKVWSEAKEILEGFAKDELLDMAEMEVKIKGQGRVFTRLIASAFDSYLQNSPRRHAKAV